MKKIIAVALLVTLILALTGCGLFKPDTPDITASPSITGVPQDPSESPAVPGAVVSGGILLPSGALPDTGYAPAPPLDRFYPETTLELIPSPDYGQIYPYIGGYTGAMWMSSEKLGVCDGRGKIICDPVFNDAQIIEHGGDTLYAFIKYDNIELDGLRYENRYITTLATPDGSRVETYDSVIWREKSSYELSTVQDQYGVTRSYYWREAVDYDYITARRDGRWGVLDWDGSVLLPFDYLEPVCFYEGVASVLSEDGQTVSFIDITGKAVLGPYVAPPRQRDEWDYSGSVLPITNKLMFHEGLTRYYDSGKYGIINRSGDIVIPAEYDYITSFSGGTALFPVLIEVDGEQRETAGIINSEGVVIAELAFGVWPENINGMAVLRDYNADKHEIVAFDGTRTPYIDDDRMTTSVSIYGSTITFADHELTFPEGIYVDVLPDKRFIVFNREEGTWYLIDYDGNALTEERPGGNLRSAWGADGYLYIYAPDGGYSGSGSPYMVFDRDGNQLLQGAYSTIIPFGDKFLVRGKSTAGIVDSDGVFIIEVPITSFFPD